MKSQYTVLLSLLSLSLVIWTSAYLEAEQTVVSRFHSVRNGGSALTSRLPYSETLVSFVSTAKSAYGFGVISRRFEPKARNRFEMNLWSNQGELVCRQSIESEVGFFSAIVCVDSMYLVINEFRGDIYAGYSAESGETLPIGRCNAALKQLEAQIVIGTDFLPYIVSAARRSVYEFSLSLVDGEPAICEQRLFQFDEPEGYISWLEYSKESALGVSMSVSEQGVALYYEDGERVRVWVRSESKWLQIVRSGIVVNIRHRLRHPSLVQVFVDNARQVVLLSTNSVTLEVGYDGKLVSTKKSGRVLGLSGGFVWLRENTDSQSVSKIDDVHSVGVRYVAVREPYALAVASARKVGEDVEVTWLASRRAGVAYSTVAMTQIGAGAETIIACIADPVYGRHLVDGGKLEWCYSPTREAFVVWGKNGVEVKSLAIEREMLSVICREGIGGWDMQEDMYYTIVEDGRGVRITRISGKSLQEKHEILVRCSLVIGKHASVSCSGGYIGFDCEDDNGREMVVLFDVQTGRQLIVEPQGRLSFIWTTDELVYIVCGGEYVQVVSRNSLDVKYCSLDDAMKDGLVVATCIIGDGARIRGSHGDILISNSAIGCEMVCGFRASRDLGGVMFALDCYYNDMSEIRTVFVRVTDTGVYMSDAIALAGIQYAWVTDDLRIERVASRRQREYFEVSGFKFKKVR